MIYCIYGIRSWFWEFERHIQRPSVAWIWIGRKGGEKEIILEVATVLENGSL